MPERLRFFKKHQYLGKFFCLAHKNGEKELQRDIEGNAIMINGCVGRRYKVNYELIDKKAALKALYLAGEAIKEYSGRFYEGKNKGVIRSETLFNKNDIQFLLLKKAGKYYKSYFEEEKHLKEDYEYLAGE